MGTRGSGPPSTSASPARLGGASPSPIRPVPSRSPSSTKLAEEERGTDAQLPGWAVVQRSTDKGRLYKVYYGPNGEYTESKRQALLLSSGEPFTAAQLAPKTKVGNGAAPRPSLHVPRSGARARYSAGQYGEGDDGDESAVARGKPRTNGRMGKFAAAASGLDAPPRCPGTSALVRGRYGWLGTGCKRDWFFDLSRPRSLGELERLHLEQRRREDLR